MSRRANLIPSVPLYLRLPEDVRTRLDLHLWSELEGCVPRGKYQEFFLARLREHFDSDILSLAPYGIEGFIKGPAHVVLALKELIETAQQESMK